MTEWSYTKLNITNTSICQDAISICGRASSHKTQANFDPDTKTKSFLTPRRKPNQFRSLDCNQVKFDPPHWKQVNNDHPDKNQVNCDAYTKAKRFAARIQNRVSFDNHHPQKIK